MSIIELATTHQWMLKNLRKGKKITLHYTLVEWFIPHLYPGESLRIESGAGSDGTHMPTISLETNEGT